MNLKQIQKIDIQTKQLVKSLFLGNYKAAFKWRWLEFSDFREYDSWDDAKHIDWLISAREGKTIIRRYVEERELEVLFVLDVSSSMWFWEEKKKGDMLHELFYILWFSALQNGDKVGALILWKGQKPTLVPYSKKKQSLLSIVRAAQEHTDSVYSESISLEYLNTLPVKPAMVFVVSDKLCIDTRSFQIAKHKHDVVFMRVTDTFEEYLEGNGIKMLKTPSGNIAINLDDTKKKNEYIGSRKQKINILRKELLGYGIDYLEVDINDNPYKKILQLMRRREW